MITINQARKLKEVFDKLKKDIMSNNVTFNDIAVMAEISDRMKADVIDIKDIVNGIDIPYEVVEDEDVEETEEPTTPTPTTESFSVPEPKGFWTEMDADAEWRLVSDGNYMVSDKGMIVSLDQERVMRPMFIDGELRISIDDTVANAKRASVMICKAFGKKSPDKYGDYVIDYMDGDRQNLSLSNLYWVKRSDRKPKRAQEILHEDICRRILDNKGDVSAILKIYEGSKPVVTAPLIEGLINGHISKDISSKFFDVKDGKVIPKEGMTPTGGQTEGVDIAGFLLISKDKELVKKLLNDKIKSGQKLSIPDKKVMTFIAIDSMGVRKNDPDPQKVRNIITNNYGSENVDEDIINECISDYTSELAIAFGRTTKEEE